MSNECKYNKFFHFFSLLLPSPLFTLLFSAIIMFFFQRNACWQHPWEKIAETRSYISKSLLNFLIYRKWKSNERFLHKFYFFELNHCHLQYIEWIPVRMGEKKKTGKMQINFLAVEVAGKWTANNFHQELFEWGKEWKAWTRHSATRKMKTMAHNFFILFLFLFWILPRNVQTWDPHNFRFNSHEYSISHFFSFFYSSTSSL